MILLDILFHIVHLAVIIINLTFWLSAKTRKIHLVVMLTTLFSWIAVGAFYGWGYCFLTDWHWRLKISMGETTLPHNYLAYLANNLMGLSLDEGLIDHLTYIVFGLAILLSSIVHLKAIKTRK